MQKWWTQGYSSQRCNDGGHNAGARSAVTRNVAVRSVAVMEALQFATVRGTALQRWKRCKSKFFSPFFYNDS
jgi:hypothetical protein